MNKTYLFFTVASLAIVSPAIAQVSAAASAEATSAASSEEGQTPANAATEEIFSTGVAKGRDRLDAAISTSTLSGNEIRTINARSVAEIVRNIPGIRAEAGNGDINNNYSIRGLPLSSSGAKYLQFQEDGLPVLEFGDLPLPADAFIRPDLNLAQVEAIRGGSASTFASNSPGGVINFISKTGEVEGGAVQVSTGLDFDEKRLDFAYGSSISDTLRFHVGGFYRSGEGPRDTGYTAYKGGQLKLNVTKDFDSGYIRLSGKLLDDHTPTYPAVPVRVTGTNANPDFASVASFDLGHGSAMSPYVANIVTLDGQNQLVQHDLRDGVHAKVRAIGVEGRFDVAGFTITNKFRFSDISGQMTQYLPAQVMPADALAAMFGGAGAQLTYATGPNTGQVIADPSSLNGNGLLAMVTPPDLTINSMDNMTNDLRATRQWDVGSGVLTATAGFYKSTQAFDSDWLFTSAVSDVRGDGNAALVDITTAAGVPVTQNGVLAYSRQPGSGEFRRRYDVDFDVSAPYGSLNYMIGKFALGGSIRYDMGKAEGQVYGVELGGDRVGLIAYDVNGDGVISAPESSTAVLPLTSPAPVDFDYDYVSYSLSLNYRVAEPFAVFGRYSRGGRGAADRVLFTPMVSSTTGDFAYPDAAYDTVQQAEAGLKYRQGDLMLNLTGFWAKTNEVNRQQVNLADGTARLEIISRDYKAIGAELEGGIRRGPFSLTAGATYTDAEIAGDDLNPAIVGNVPRRQAKFIFQATPQFENEMFTVGANVIGTTSSYAQDTNQLKMPGFTVVNGFLQFRPTDRLQLSLNANNLFDVVGFTEISQGSIPDSNIVTGRVINGRTVSMSLGFTF